jgi:hypothetical protein
MKELERDNTTDSQTNLTWQCWMVNANTQTEKLITHGHLSQEECYTAAMSIFATWDVDSYPSGEGWQVVYRQDSLLKMAQYWRDYHQERARFWSQRYEEVLNSDYQSSGRSLPQIEGQQRTAPTQHKKLVRRRKRVAPGSIKASSRPRKPVIGAVLRMGQVIAATLFFAIAPEVIAFITQSPKDSQYIAQHVTDIPLSIRELFGTKKAPGSIAVGVAEGNLSPSGKPTSIYSGHTDPGNFATNRGFCSWNKAQGLSVAEADRQCLEALQWQSVATENHLIDLGFNPQSHKAAIVVGTDLWNQSNYAGSMFPVKYKAAKDKGITGQQAYLWARVESFRNEQQQLDASGLFGICKREPYYQQQLKGLQFDSEEWRWNCIKLDQLRRILEIEKILKASDIF